MNYKEIIQSVLDNGVPKQATRMENGKAVNVENGTIGTFCEVFRHDMSQGFPLTTLRKMPWRSLRVELEGFIKGITDKKWYQERKCKYWDYWANPQEVEKELRKFRHQEDMMFEGYMNDPEAMSDYPYISDEEMKNDIQKELSDLGPIYGYQWRNFGEHYGEVCHFEECPSEYTSHDGSVVDQNGLDRGADQLQSIVDKLHNNPYDRRMICSAWNPNQMDMMALPPCHYSWGVVVYGDTLNLSWNQRSVDCSHGLPSNIASYALLQLLLCEESGLKPGELVGKLEDCHLYDNTIPAVKELIKKEEKELPQVKIKRKEDGSFSIFNWVYDEVELAGYDPYPKLDMGKVTV